MIPGVLFDLDGTLVDTVYLHAVCWWQALRQHGLEVDTARAHRAIGMGSDRILDHLAPDRPDKDDDDGIRAAHSALYAQYWDRIRPTAGARDLVRAVDAHGLRVVLASSAGPAELAAVRRARLLTGGWSDTELRDAGAVEIHDGPRALLAALDGSTLAG